MIMGSFNNPKGLNNVTDSWLCYVNPHFDVNKVCNFSWLLMFMIKGYLMKIAVKGENDVLLFVLKLLLGSKRGWRCCFLS